VKAKTTRQPKVLKKEDFSTPKPVVANKTGSAAKLQNSSVGKSQPNNNAVNGNNSRKINTVVVNTSPVKPKTKINNNSRNVSKEVVVKEPVAP
jgi:hypothetical protein